MTRKVLLVCGILSSLLYAAMTVFIARQWEGYSFASRTISELSAIGAPTRWLWAIPASLYTLLVTAFGLGVRASARTNRALRVSGILIASYGALGLVWPFAPMHLREVLAAGGGTLSDTMHLVLASITVLLMLAAIGFGAAALGKRFRAYSVVTLVVLGLFGALTFKDAPRVGANLPTPWIGVWERINIAAFLLWVMALALILLRERTTQGAIGRSIHSSAFKTREGEETYRAAYADAMRWWPVAYEEISARSRFGLTHVVVSGPREAPPLVLLHGYWSTLTMWTRNIADFSREYRVYAIDVMGQPSLSIPDRPIRNAAEYVEWLTATLDALHLNRVSLIGMSYGGWLALSYAMAASERVQTLTLLSPAASVLPIVRQFGIRGMLMAFFPARLTVNSFMRWLGINDRHGDPNARRARETVIEMIYLGMRHCRISRETMRIAPTTFSDEALRMMRVPTLLLIGEREVIYDPVRAIARAHRLLPHLDSELVPDSGHDMTFSQYRRVNARVLAFLNGHRRLEKRGAA